MTDTPHISPTLPVLCLVRHGQTDWNAARRMQGHTDTALNDRGVEQAGAVARELSNGRWDALYASTLRRALTTAEIIGEAVGLTPVGEPGLWERDYGDREGLTPEESRRRFPWAAGPGSVGVPDMETDDRFHRRIRLTLHRIASGHPGGRILVVTHGGVMLACLRYLCQPPAASERIDNCGTVLLEYRGLGRLGPVPNACREVPG